jgi:hypothetical protein
MLKKSQKFVSLTSTSLIAMLVCSFSNPAVAERACVKTDAGKVVCGQLVQNGSNRNAPKPNSSIPLEGKYSFSWVEEANKTNQCWQTGTLRELTISADGLMQGAFSGGNYTFSGKVNPDGSWLAALNTSGYEFKGNISNGVISGTYIARVGSPFPADSKQCQGKVTGFKKPN